MRIKIPNLRPYFIVTHHFFLTIPAISFILSKILSHFAPLKKVDTLIPPKYPSYPSHRAVSPEIIDGCTAQAKKAYLSYLSYLSHFETDETDRDAYHFRSCASRLPYISGFGEQ